MVAEKKISETILISSEMAEACRKAGGGSVKLGAVRLIELGMASEGEMKRSLVDATEALERAERRMMDISARFENDYISLMEAIFSPESKGEE